MDNTACCLKDQYLSCNQVLRPEEFTGSYWVNITFTEDNKRWMLQSARSEFQAFKLLCGCDIVD